jgi:hypothetical protein
MDEETNEIMNFIEGLLEKAFREAMRDPIDNWYTQSDISNIQTIVNSACNKSYDEGYNQAEINCGGRP